MRANLTNKPQTPIAGTTNSISVEFEDDLVEVLNRELRLISPLNTEGSKKTKSTGSQDDLLEKYRSRLRDR